MNRSLIAWASLPLLVLSSAACDQNVRAWGDENSIVAAVDSTLWSQIDEQVYDAIETTVFTVGDEKTFTVTHQDPRHEFWGNLSRFRQMLVIGTMDEPHVARALEEVDDRDSFNPPEILQVSDVWARGQTVTILLLPEEGKVEAVENRLDELSELYDQEYRRFAVNRMYISGVDSMLADTLMNQFGFSLTVPQVYYWDQRDSVIILRNDNPDPSELIRQIAVTWRSPIPDPEEFQADQMLEWRAELAAQHYGYPQTVNLDRVQAGPEMLRDLQTYQIQAIWQNPPDSDWPAGGPFILRSVLCPEQDRVYLLDAWLYAPGTQKYEYMIQLETILDTFRCGPA